MMKRVPDRQPGPPRPMEAGGGPRGAAKGAPGDAPRGPSYGPYGGPSGGPRASAQRPGPAQVPQGDRVPQAPRRDPRAPYDEASLRDDAPPAKKERRRSRRRSAEREGQGPVTTSTPPEQNEQGEASDETLLVIEDLDNGRDYYMGVVDQFPVGDRDYIVFTHYTQDTGDHREPDFVLMRVLPGDDGQQYYASIRDKEELDIVFEKFFERMQGDLLGEA